MSNAVTDEKSEGIDRKGIRKLAYKLYVSTECIRSGTPILIRFGHHFYYMLVNITQAAI